MQKKPLFNDKYIVAYAKVRGLNIKHMRYKLLKSIDGNIHVQCEEHSMPLIASTTRYDHWSECGRTDYMRCYAFHCKVFLMQDMFHQ